MEKVGGVMTIDPSMSVLYRKQLSTEQFTYQLQSRSMFAAYSGSSWLFL